MANLLINLINLITTQFGSLADDSILIDHNNNKLNDVDWACLHLLAHWLILYILVASPVKN